MVSRGKRLKEKKDDGVKGEIQEFIEERNSVVESKSIKKGRIDQ
jgi:hypothetical protein